jgi:hypothetical protein
VGSVRRELLDRVLIMNATRARPSPRTRASATSVDHTGPWLFAQEPTTGGRWFQMPKDPQHDADREVRAPTERSDDFARSERPGSPRERRAQDSCRILQPWMLGGEVAEGLIAHD